MKTTTTTTTTTTAEAAAATTTIRYVLECLREEVRVHAIVQPLGAHVGDGGEAARHPAVRLQVLHHRLAEREVEAGVGGAEQRIPFKVVVVVVVVAVVAISK